MTTKPKRRLVLNPTTGKLEVLIDHYEFKPPTRKERLTQQTSGLHTFVNVPPPKISTKRKPLIYFTQPQPFSNYCLLPVKEYEKRGAKNPICASKKMIFLDPNVFDLKKFPDYEYAPFLHQMVQGTHQKYKLEPNEWISIDYSTFYGKTLQEKQRFLKMSIDNNFKYKDNPQYICAIQSGPDMVSFRQEFERLEPVFANNPKKILAIGGWVMGKQNHHPNHTTDNLYRFLLQKADKMSWIHFYAASLPCIKTYFKDLMDVGIQVSTDSTKWKYGTDEIRDLYHCICIRGEKQPGRLNPNLTCANEYFNAYMGEIQRSGVSVIW